MGNLGPPLLSEDLPSVIDVVLGDIGTYFLPDIKDPDAEDTYSISI